MNMEHPNAWATKADSEKLEVKGWRIDANALNTGLLNTFGMVSAAQFTEAISVILSALSPMYPGDTPAITEHTDPHKDIVYQLVEASRKSGVLGAIQMTLATGPDAVSEETFARVQTYQALQEEQLALVDDLRTELRGRLELIKGLEQENRYLKEVAKGNSHDGTLTKRGTAFNGEPYERE